MSNNKTLGDEHFKIKLDTPLALSRHAHIIFNSDHQAAKAWLETLNFSEQEWNLSKRKLKKIDTFLPKKEAISECYYNIFSPRRKFLPVVSCFDYERLPCLQREEMVLVARVKMRGYWRPQPTSPVQAGVHCPVEQTRATTVGWFKNPDIGSAPQKMLLRHYLSQRKRKTRFFRQYMGVPRLIKNYIGPNIK